jgi:hydrogenase maturation protease
MTREGRGETVVVGLGNPLMGDDGLGIGALAALRARWTFEPPVRFVEGGTSGLRLLPMLTTASHVLFLDAIDVGARPGTPLALAGDDLPRLFAPVVSGHELGLRHVLALAELSGARPEAIEAIGLQPGVVGPPPGLSPAVAAALPGLLAEVVARLASWGHAARPAERACTS